MSLISSLLARCCCGPGEPSYNGNPNCIPLCAGQPNDLKVTFAATSQFFSRGTPTGFQNVNLGCDPCDWQTSLWTSGNFDVGSYPSTYIQNLFPRALPGGNGCEVCDTLTITWTPSAQSFTAVVRNPQFVTQGPNGTTLSVTGEPFNVQSTWFTCNPIAQGGLDPWGCSGWTGLFDVVIIRAGRVQASPFFPIYGSLGDAGACPVGPVEDGYAYMFLRTTQMSAMYVKAVPFSSCRNRTGEYYLAASEASYPFTEYADRFAGFPGAGRLWSDPCSLEAYDLCYPPSYCSSEREARCGKGPPGWTIPSTITVTAL